VVTGPRGWPHQNRIGVVSSTDIGDRTSGLVRLEAGATVFGPGWEECQPTFDELAFGYLAARGPRLTGVPA
jgi:ABC-2 type transport system ATP-binding protein